MERNKTYLKMLFSNQPELEELIDIKLYLNYNSLIEINNDIKEILRKNNIDTRNLSMVNINDLNFISNLNKMKIKN